MGYFLKNLKQMYLDRKGTSDEFEVIYITNGKKQFPDDEHITDVPSWFVPSWFVSLASELLPIDLKFVLLLFCHLQFRYLFLLLFGAPVGAANLANGVEDLQCLL